MSRPGLALSVLFAVAASSVAVGCLTFINTDPGGLSTQSCGFKGSDAAACGACIAAKCQAAVDACCRDQECRKYQLDHLDKCATGDSSECKSFYTDPGNALEDCIKTGCGPECTSADAGALGDGGLKTKCTSGTDYCSCVPAAVSDGKTCTPGMIGDALCCVDDTWPASGSACTCKRWSCKGSTSSCTCGTNVDGPWSSCSGTQFQCCFSSLTGDCDCRTSFGCTSSETQVPACSLEYVSCAKGQTRITESCALPP